MEKTYIIYKIECKTTLEDGYVYVGSTSAFRKRKCTHKASCCNEATQNHNLKIYEIIRANGGWDNWEMKPVEELKATKRQAEIREQYWIDHYKPVLNSIRAIQDAEITRQKQKIRHQTEEYKKYSAEQSKKRYAEHQEEHNKNMLEYYYKTKEATKEVRNKRAKEYRELHREEINKKQNEKYYEKKTPI